MFSVLVWLTGSSANTAPVVPLDNAAAGVVCDSSTGHCYEYVAGPLTWDAAKVAAEAMTHNGVRGHLATVTSQAETDFIVANLPDAVYFHPPFDGGAYIGAYQLPGSSEPNGGWQWVTGEPWSYTKWAGGEPNNSGNEDVLNFWSTAGAWNDVDRGLAKGYLVEYSKRLGSDLVIGRQGDGQKGFAGMLFGDGSGGFTLNTSGFDTGGEHEVAVGDVNNDGQDDVVVVASGGPAYAALGNFTDGMQKHDFTSVGAFVEASPNCCNRVRTLQLGDVNNDGNLDIVVTMWVAVGVKLGNGDGTFGSPILTNAGGDARGMALGDVDGDGNLDVVANHATGNWSIAVYRGKGDGTFRPGAGIPTSALAIPNVFIADADGDDDLDIYSGSLGGARLKIFTNDGSAGFTLTDVEPGAGHWGRPLVVDDLNGDGKADAVVVSEAESNTNVRVLLSNENGGFASVDYGSVAWDPRHGVVADINEDGIKDIAISSSHPTNTNGVSILVGTGNGAFNRPYGVTTYAKGYTIAAGNFDGAATPTDTTPPVITSSVSGTLGGDDWYTSDVTVVWSVTDPESSFTTSGCDTQTVTSDTAGTTFTCSATSVGGPSSESVTIKRDTRGPAIASATASPGMLWPPNNKMVAITVSVDASDAGSGAVACSIDSVDSNEGGSAHEPDVELKGDLTMNLRAERNGNGSGRVYTAHISCTDAAGNGSSSTATVTVPHDQGKGKGRK